MEVPLGKNTKNPPETLFKLLCSRQSPASSPVFGCCVMKSMHQNRFHRAVGRFRRGLAAMETAVCLPFIVTMVFSGVELCNAVFLKQSLNLAAYEAAKLITAPGNNAEKATTRVQQILASRKVKTYTLTSSPTVTAMTPTGTVVTVLVTAPASNLSYGPVGIMMGRTVSSTVVMVRL